MKSNTILAVLCAAVLAGCATSQAPAPATASTAASKPARTAQQIQMDELIDDAKAHAILQKHAPAIADHPQLSMARGMTLADVAGYAEAGLSPEMVQAIVDDINKL
jgi:hypothetical protein